MYIWVHLSHLLPPTQSIRIFERLFCLARRDENLCYHRVNCIVIMARYADWFVYDREGSILM